MWMILMFRWLHSVDHQLKLLIKALSSHLPSKSKDPSQVGSAMCFECPRKDWRGKSCWLHPSESGPEVVQEPGGAATSPILFGPVLVWSQQKYLWLLKTIRYFESSYGCYAHDHPQRKSDYENEKKLCLVPAPVVQPEWGRRVHGHPRNSFVKVFTGTLYQFVSICNCQKDVSVWRRDWPAPPEQNFLLLCWPALSKSSFVAPGAVVEPFYEQTLFD